MNPYSKIDKQIAEGRARETLENRAIYSQGTTTERPLFYRFAVIEVIFDPTIIDKNKIGYYQHTLGVSNIKFATVLPRNAIIAQKINSPGTAAISAPMFLFPFFPSSISMPCQPGEHVWVMFENPSGTKNDLGFWFCKIVEPGYVEDVNHTHPPRSLDASFSPGIQDVFDGTNLPTYEFRNGKPSIIDGARYTLPQTALISGDEDTYEKLMTQTDAGKVNVYEPVPRFKKRPGDIALEGTNNALIVIGRDRTGAAATYVIDETNQSQTPDSLVPNEQKTNRGSIDMVVGRGQTPRTGGNVVESLSINGQPTGFSEIAKDASRIVPDEGDPDFISDKSRIYLSQKTQVDLNFGISQDSTAVSAGTIQGGTPEKSTVADSLDGDGGIVIKSDKIRLIARSDLEIIVTSYTEKDATGNYISSINVDDHAIVAIKANGDIVFKPAKHGYVKLGGDDANKGIVCTDTPVTAINGGISGPPLTTTMGGLFAGAAPAGDDNVPALAATQAKYANKVLIK